MASNATRWRGLWTSGRGFLGGGVGVQCWHYSAAALMGRGAGPLVYRYLCMIGDGRHEPKEMGRLPFLR